MRSEMPFKGQLLADGRVIERLRAPAGATEIVLSEHEALQLKVGRHVMEQWRETLAILGNA